jgi:hypothetical protein
MSGITYTSGSTPTATTTPTVTPTVTPTNTVTQTPTNTPTPTVTPTNTSSNTQTPTPTPTNTITPTNTSTVTSTNTPTNTEGLTPTPTPTNTPTSETPTPTPTNTVTPTVTPTNTSTVTQTPTNTPTSETPTPTNTSSNTQTPTPTPTVTPTVTPTNTSTPTNTVTQTPTNTVTPTLTQTPTNTPTSALVVPECAVLLQWESNDIYYYDVNTNNKISLNFYTGSTGLDIAHTQNKFWNYDSSFLYEYNITLNPWSYSFNRSISTSLSLGNGLCSKDNTGTRLISSLYRISGNGERIVELEITGSSANIIYQFDMLPDRFVAGDIVYTTTGKLLVTNLEYTLSFQGNYITQYDYATGTMEIDVLISPTIDNPYGLFEDNGVIYIGDFDGDIYSIDTNYPYTLTSINNSGVAIAGASQVPSCINTHLNPQTTLTPTPTPTLTPTLTPTQTVTPTVTTTVTPTNTITVTQTVTPTLTTTVTPTNTQTPTNTTTPTPSITEYPPVVAYFSSCCSNFEFRVFSIPFIEAPVVGNVYYVEALGFSGCATAINSSLTSNSYQYQTLTLSTVCETCTTTYICPTPTPTPTATSTPTPTVTPTQTLTPTLTVTSTQTQTPTNTVTPTPTKTSIVCNCFTFFNTGITGSISVSYYDCDLNLQNISIPYGSYSAVCVSNSAYTASTSVVYFNGNCSSGCPTINRNECDVFVLDWNNRLIYNFDPSNDTAIPLPIDLQSSQIGHDIATFGNYLWILARYLSGSTTITRIKEYTFVNSPFSATFSRFIDLPSQTVFVNSQHQGLAAINSTTLLTSSGSSQNLIVSVDITNPIAVLTPLFNLPPTRSLRGDLIYTNTSKIIAHIYDVPIPPLSASSYYMQFDFFGNLEVEIPVGNVFQGWSFYSYNNELYSAICSLTSRTRRKYNLTSPYSFTSEPNMPIVNAGMAQPPSCININFIPVTPTPTPTQTVTPTITPTNTVTPTNIIEKSFSGCPCSNGVPPGTFNFTGFGMTLNTIYSLDPNGVYYFNASGVDGCFVIVNQPAQYYPISLKSARIDYVDCPTCCNDVPTPTPTATPTTTPTNTQTTTVTSSLTPTVTETVTPTVTETPTYTPSQTVTITPTSTITPSPTNECCGCDTINDAILPGGENIYLQVGNGLYLKFLEQSPLISPSPTPTNTQTPSFTPSQTTTYTPSQTFTPTRTITPSPTLTVSPTTPFNGEATLFLTGCTTYQQLVVKLTGLTINQYNLLSLPSTIYIPQLDCCFVFVSFVNATPDYVLPSSVVYSGCTECITVQSPTCIIPSGCRCINFVNNTNQTFGLVYIPCDDPNFATFTTIPPLIIGQPLPGFCYLQILSVTLPNIPYFIGTTTCSTDTDCISGF